MTFTTHSPEQITITLPITRLARETAAQFAGQQPTPEKAEQVRLNTLAVCAVNQYCEMMGIPTDLRAGDSWMPLKQFAADVADLELVGVGRLECRPVSVDDRVCVIPPEVWADRIGYVMVQLDPVALEATLLGFVPEAAPEPIALNQLQSLDALIDHIHALTEAAPTALSGLTNLGQWLSGQIASGWQTVEALLDLLNAEPEFAFRSSPGQAVDSPSTRRAKLLHLSTREVDYPLVLVVEVIPRSPTQRSVYAQLHPIDFGTPLPEHLRLIGLDQTGAFVLESQARQADDYIQLRFRGAPGEPFRLQIVLGDATLTEDFVI